MDLFEDTRTGQNAPEFTVSEISGAVKRVIEGEFGQVRVRGEVSRVTRHASGHVYFDLKDAGASLGAVAFRSTVRGLTVQPEEGMEVIATGRLSTFQAASKYQLIVDAIAPAGVGALMAMLDARRKALEAEGLFAAERKRRLPYLPEVIGVITSPSGAVIRDILHRLRERFPRPVLLWPVTVQGPNCAGEVAAAIRGFNAIAPGGPVPRPDVLIVARGGGSIEDLWGFNEEIVVRAVAASRIPVISAVGHETNWTLIDLVADARAPTPTKAAEWAVPKFAELADSTEKCGSRLTAAARRMLQQSRAHLKAAVRGLPRLEDVLALPRQRFDACEKRLGRALLANARIHHTRYARIAGRLRPTPILNRLAVCGERAGALQARAGQALRNGVAGRRRQLEGYDKLLATLSYQSVLQRGFALVRDAQGRAVRSVTVVTPGDRLDVELRDGRIEAEAQSVRPADSTSPPPVSAPQPTPGVRRTRGRSGGSQGSLF